MPKLPGIAYRDAVRVLEKAGWRSLLSLHFQNTVLHFEQCGDLAIPVALGSKPLGVLNAFYEHPIL